MSPLDPVLTARLADENVVENPLADTPVTAPRLVRVVVSDRADEVVDVVAVVAGPGAVVVVVGPGAAGAGRPARVLAAAEAERRGRVPTGPAATVAAG